MDEKSYDIPVVGGLFESFGRFKSAIGFMVKMLTFNIDGIPIFFNAILDIMFFTTVYLIYVSVRGE